MKILLFAVILLFSTTAAVESYKLGNLTLPMCPG